MRRFALGVDGINVDLEQVSSEAGEDYVEFLRGVVHILQGE